MDIDLREFMERLEASGCKTFLWIGADGASVFQLKTTDGQDQPGLGENWLLVRLPEAQVEVPAPIMIVNEFEGQIEIVSPKSGVVTLDLARDGWPYLLTYQDQAAKPWVVMGERRAG